jgi:endoglucanase
VSFDVDADGGQQILTVTSNGQWQIDFSDISWARPAITSSAGTVKVQITIDENDSENERSGVLKIFAGGHDDIFVTITQAGKSAGDEEPGTSPEAWIEPDNTDMRDLSSLQLSSLMGVGWNLGNSLEAIVVNNGVFSGDETSWGNPATTKTLIDSVRLAGFKTIRMPVSWSHKLVDQETFKISDAWLNRVEEVVNYALDNDLFVIVNIHWDGGWMNHTDYEHQVAINNKLAALWQQIAIHFRNYDDRLLFAGSNEVMMENDYGTPSAEYVEVQNSFNQTFVSTVRATGGRNHYRHLVVQGFNTNITYTYNYFVMPDDVIDNRLMAEVHYYDPYEFALKENSPYDTQWGEPFAGGDVTAWGQEDWVNEAFGMMKEMFVDNGIPVVMGEYGAIHRTSLIGESYELHNEAREYYLEYVTQKALENGLVPVYWDNGSDGNNGFTLFDRNSGEVIDQGALNAIMKGAGGLSE